MHWLSRPYALATPQVWLLCSPSKGCISPLSCRCLFTALALRTSFCCLELQPSTCMHIEPGDKLWRLQETPLLLGPAGLESGSEQPRHTGYMRLDFKLGSACLALLDDRSDHCLEALAVTLQVIGVLRRVLLYPSTHHAHVRGVFWPVGRLRDFTDICMVWPLLCAVVSVMGASTWEYAEQDVDMHFGSPGDGGSTFGHVRAALEFTFLNSAVDANGEIPALLRVHTHALAHYTSVWMGAHKARALCLLSYSIHDFCAPYVRMLWKRQYADIGIWAAC